MNLTKDRATRFILAFSGIVILSMLLISGWAWSQIPDDALVPVHWNISGEPDRYGSKFSGLFTLPLITTGLVILFSFLPYIDPKRANLARSRKAYLAAWAVILIFMLLVHGVVTLEVVGRNVNLISIISIGLGILLLIIGNYMGKIRSNYMFGIRTPWTLASELAWNKTHRLGGKLFVLVGILTILGALFTTGGLLLYIILGGVLGSTIVLSIYSYLIWKSDPKVNASM